MGGYPYRVNTPPVLEDERNAAAKDLANGKAGLSPSNLHVSRYSRQLPCLRSPSSQAARSSASRKQTPKHRKHRPAIPSGAAARLFTPLATSRLPNIIRRIFGVTNEAEGRCCFAGLIEAERLFIAQRDVGCGELVSTGPTVSQQ